MKGTAIILLFILSSTLGQLTCPSGYVEDNGSCDLSSTTTDTCLFHNATFTESVHPPDLVSLNLNVADTLTLAVSQLFVNNRVVESIKLSDNADCNYPGAFWSKSIDLEDCTDRYVAGIPWSVAYDPQSSDQMADACGLVKDDSDPNTLYYFGTMIVTYVDMLPQLDEERPISFNRTSQDELRFQISFPKQVSISATVIEFNRARLLSVVTSQVYVPSPSILRILLFTSVQSPFHLTDVHNSTAPERLSLSGPTLSQDCPTSFNGELCAQVWQVEVSRQLDKCDFSGSYTFLYEVSCHHNATDCPLVEPEYHSVTLTLSTGDVCGTVQNSTSVQAQLTTFAGYDTDTESFIGSRSNFFVDEPISYRLSISSNGLSLANTAVDSVVATNFQGSPVTLVSSGSIDYPISLSITRVSTISKQHIYHLQLSYDVSWFGRLPADGNIASATTVTVTLEFANNQKRSLQVRLPTSNNSVKATTQVVLSENQLTTPEMSSATSVTLNVTLYFTIISFVLLLSSSIF